MQDSIPTQAPGRPEDDARGAQWPGGPPWQEAVPLLVLALAAGILPLLALLASGRT